MIALPHVALHLYWEAGKKKNRQDGRKEGRKGKGVRGGEKETGREKERGSYFLLLICTAL